MGLVSWRRRAALARPRALVAAATAAATFGLVTLSAAADDVAVRCATLAESASAEQDNGQVTAALQNFEACAVDACPKIVREDCRRGLLELRSRAPRIFVRVRDRAGSDVVDATVWIDGRETDRGIITKGMIVDPGVHRVRVSRRVSVEQTVVIAGADRERLVEVVLPPESAPPASSPSPSLSPAGPSEGGSPKPSRVPALVVGGLGLATIAAGGVLGAVTLADYHDLRDRCRGACTEAEVASTDTRAVVVDVLFGVGVASLAAAAILWIIADSRR